MIYLFICDLNFLTNSFEKLSYESLEDEDFIGFFLTNKDNTSLYASLIIDLNCNINEKVIKDNKYNINNSIEITLLCTNKKIRVPLLTTKFAKFVISELILNIKRNSKHVFLYVAKNIENNRNAFNFYSRIGFKLLNNSDAVMVYDIEEKRGGGKKQRRRRTRKRFNFQ